MTAPRGPIPRKRPLHLASCGSSNRTINHCCVWPSAKSPAPARSPASGSRCRSHDRPGLCRPRSRRRAALLVRHAFRWSAYCRWPSLCSVPLITPSLLIANWRNSVAQAPTPGRRASRAKTPSGIPFRLLGATSGSLATICSACCAYSSAGHRLISVVNGIVRVVTFSP